MKYFFIFRFLSSHIGDILAGLLLILLISIPTLALVGILLLGDRDRTWRKPAIGVQNSLKFVLVLVLLFPLIPPPSLFTVTICVILFAGDFSPDALLIWYVANLPGLIYLLFCALGSRTLLSMPSYSTKPKLLTLIRDAAPIAIAILLFPPFNFLYLRYVIAAIRGLF